MINYDFRNLLSSFEFECFSRDLINAHEGLDLANFAEGRRSSLHAKQREYSYRTGKTIQGLR